MSAIKLRAAEDCRYDIVSLGEVMLRLDPGEGRDEGPGQPECCIGLDSALPGRAANGSVISDDWPGVRAGAVFA